MSQPVFFAHANGFPSATYNKLFKALGSDFQISYLEQHAHDPRFPVNENWSNLIDELVHHLERMSQPVLGIGHSLGGVLHYYAALRRPELYKGVVMLDSPVLTARDRFVLRAAKQFGFIDRITPAGRTLRRREEFPDPLTARDYFAGKALFSSFDPECLDAYVQHGLKMQGQSWRLRFNPSTEISIYRNVPHVSPGPIRQLKVPLALMHGQQSRVVMSHHVRLLRRLPEAECLTMAGGHMFPLERPQDTAEAIRGVFKRWNIRTGQVGG